MINLKLSVRKMISAIKRLGFSEILSLFKSEFNVKYFAVSIPIIAAAVSAGTAAHSLSLKLAGYGAVGNEIRTYAKENAEIEKKQEKIRNDIFELDSKIREKSGTADYAASLDETKRLLDEAKQTDAALDAEIEKKREYLKNSKNISALKRGRTVSVSDETLRCPSQIEAGRYIAEGDGYLLVYSSSNSLRLSEDLKKLDTNSYTFDLAEGESMRVSGSASVTELTE